MLTKLVNFLESNHIHYLIKKHQPKYSSQEIAAVSHVSGHLLAKPVIIKVDNQLIMCVIPGDCTLDLAKLNKQVNARSLTLAEESDFEHVFTDCEVGAMPIFGHFFNMTVWMEKTMETIQQVSFNAGTHTELCQMQQTDYQALEKPALFFMIKDY